MIYYLRGRGMKSFKAYIEEMAKNIGMHSYSPLNSSRESGKTIRNHKFLNTNKDPIIEELPDHVKLHKREFDNKTEYTTNDHKNEQTLHRALIVHRRKTAEFPFEHEEQTEVDRVKGSDKLPKGHATKVTYDHFEHSNLPLRSSDLQFQKGHEMWHRLVDRALKDGHHAYHWDGERLHKTSTENKEEHLKNSFGKGDEYKNKHMIISKNELK